MIKNMNIMPIQDLLYLIKSQAVVDYEYSQDYTVSDAEKELIKRIKGLTITIDQQKRRIADQEIIIGNAKDVVKAFDAMKKGYMKG